MAPVQAESSSSVQEKSASPPYQTSVLEADSAATEGDDWTNDDFASITESIVDYEFENGRRYHAFKAGYYPLPNDENELDRLDLQYHVTNLALDGELYLAPLESLNPRKILDVGTGTGIWAMEMADRFPSAKVIGTDLSPVQPTWVPDNIEFEINDCEGDWMFNDNYFDYIHIRWMIGSISNWQETARKAFRHLRPGGYLEIQELDPRLTSDDNTVNDTQLHSKFTHLICEASEKYGKPVPFLPEYKPMLQAAGFVDVKEKYFKIPINTWPKSKKMKEVGKYQLLNYYEGYEGIAVGLFTRALHWRLEELQVFLAKMRHELKDRRIHAYQNFGSIYGRKPLPREVATTRNGV